MKPVLFKKAIGLFYKRAFLSQMPEYLKELANDYIIITFSMKKTKSIKDYQIITCIKLESLKQECG